MARDPDGAGFSREELIDQLGVMFLAGHETSASALTWAFYILANRPDIVGRIREEVNRVAGAGPIQFEHIKALAFTRNVFRETVRLYPPITFLPRVALENTQIGGRKIPRGALVIVAPWVLHRHRAYWAEPDVFDPDRFLPEREAGMTSGAYIPFGIGPRVCAGAAFAQVEACLIIASLVAAFRLQPDRRRQRRARRAADDAASQAGHVPRRAGGLMKPGVLLTLGRLPKGLDVARSFAQAGWRVIVADPHKRHVVGASRAVTKSYRVPAPAQQPNAYLNRLAEIIRAEDIELVLPVSEEILHVAALRERLDSSVRVFAMPQETLLRLHDKAGFIEFAASHGLSVPRTELAGSAGALDLAAGGDYIVKLRHSCAGSGLTRGVARFDSAANRRRRGAAACARRRAQRLRHRA